MVEIAQIRAALAEAVSALVPDGRYALDVEGVLSPGYTVADDPDSIQSYRDLLVSLLVGGVGGVELVEHTWRLTVVLGLYCARYHGTRTATGSGTEITAEDRLHAAAMHLLTHLPTVPLPGCDLHPVRYDSPSVLDGGDWISTILEYTLTATE